MDTHINENITRSTICGVLPLISERIIILDLDQMLTIQKLANASLKKFSVLSQFREDDWIKAINVMTAIRKALADSWRYTRNDPNGREPVPGNKIRPKIRRMIFVQAYSQKIFTLAEFDRTEEFTIKKIGKLEVQGAMIEQRVFVTEPENIFPVDWGAFELVM